MKKKTPASDGKKYELKGWLKGGEAWPASMRKERRMEIAKTAAATRGE